MTGAPIALRERFLASARATLDSFRQYAARLDADPRDATVLDTFRRELHRLRGSAGSYGFAEVSERLGEMEQRAVTWALDATMDPEHRGAHVRRLVDALLVQFGTADDAPLPEAQGRDVWCVDLGAERVHEWSTVASSAGVRFVTMSAADFSARIAQRERPYVVIASADQGRALQVPDGLPLVLLADARRAPAPAGRSFGAVTMVDDAVSADDLLVVLDQLAHRTSVAGGSVVILDDDPMILLLARAICEDAGLRAVTLDDPARLMQTLDDERPGVLLLDVQLPRTTGFDLVRQVRANAEWADLPIILFSADASPDARERATIAGADGFLAKPVAPTELRAQLLARLEQVRRLRLAHGLNPATGLPDIEVGLRDAAQLFGAMRREGGALSAAMIRPRDAVDAGSWANVCAQVARALRGTGALVAHYDAVSVVATMRGDIDQLRRALDTVGNATHAASPLAMGLAAAATVGTTHPEDLWHAAADAAATARALDQATHAWTPDDSTRAPDVIIVEDDPAFSDLLEYVLHQGGYTFRVLRTGPEALEALRTLRVGTQKPLVLLDLDLPGLDGHAIHERLRLERPRDFTVVFLSVHTGDADQVRALRAGATDYLAKPLSLRVLLAKLPRWVRQPRSMP